MSADRFLCKGYRVEMGAFNCIENQLSDLCLPGFPCHECGAALTIKAVLRDPSPPRRVKHPRGWADMTPAVRRSFGF